MNRIINRNRQRGFVLITSLIFLVVMTLLAATAIRRSTLGEKLSNNMREQNLAFQAAEVALRFCQTGYEADPKTITPIPAIAEGMPTMWDNINHWHDGSGIAIKLPDNTVRNVAQQPQCLIEEWDMAPGIGRSSKGAVNLITARGVGSTTNAVVWLQVTLRDGN